MIYIVNVGLMLGCIVILSRFLWRTRRFDDALWWLMRFLIIHSIISVVYMTYDAIHSGFQLSLQLILIRWGFVSLVSALGLLWHLLKKQHKNHQAQLFNNRIKSIFRD